MKELSDRLVELIAQCTGVRPEPSTPERERLAEVLRALSTTVVDPGFEIAESLVRDLEVALQRVDGYASGSRFAPMGGTGPTFPMGTHPVLGCANPLAPPMAVDLVGDRIVGCVTYNVTAEGLPGSVYGGFLAAAFDAVLGFRAALEGTPCSAVSINTAIKAPTPLHVPVTYEASLRGVDGRKLYVDATLSTHEGVLTATADAVFLAVDMDKVASTKRAAGACA
jgi:hypothetical protein